MATNLAGVFRATRRASVKSGMVAPSGLATSRLPIDQRFSSTSRVIRTGGSEHTMATNSTGARGNTAGFGQVADGRPFWTGNFSPQANRTQILLYLPGDQNWWLGAHDGNQLSWSFPGNTTGMRSQSGMVAPSGLATSHHRRTERRCFSTSRVTGTGGSEHTMATSLPGPSQATRGFPAEPRTVAGRLSDRIGGWDRRCHRSRKWQTTSSCDASRIFCEPSSRSVSAKECNRAPYEILPRTTTTVLNAFHLVRARIESNTRTRPKTATHPINTSEVTDRAALAV